MKLPFSGGCLCGELRYQCTGEPELMYYCHCSDCQKSTGTAFHTGLYMKRADFELTSGTSRSFAKQAESGRTIARHFCGHCGSHLYSDKGSESEMISIRAGTLDDPGIFKPDTEIWTLGKTRWAQLPKDLESFIKGPFD